MEDVDNTTDPVQDERFPNIVAYDPDQDEFTEDDEFPCATRLMEEVNPDGT